MIDGLYFDGRSARAHAVRLQVEDGSLLAIPAEGAQTWRWPLHTLQWPETTRHGQRVLQLADGGSIEVADTAAFDRWRYGLGRHDSWVVRAQQSWRGVLLASALLLVLLAVAYRWGVPALAGGIVALVPAEVERSIGDAAWQALQSRWLRPSQLAPAHQQALRERFTAAAARAHPDAPAVEVRFHAADKALGPNALALPGGTIVFTDAMVELLADREDTLLGVFGHELGHVRQRHGMRALVQLGLVTAATSVALGDFSSWLAGVPALLGQLHYSRQAEREADLEAVHLLRANGLPAAAMVVLFERLQARGGSSSALPMALASHPSDPERIAFFRDAAP